MNLPYPQVCEECGDEPTLVGFGEKPRWLGQRCFDAAMNRVGAIRRLIADAVESHDARLIQGEP